MSRYYAPTNTRYADAEKKNSKGTGCKFQITDRSAPLAVIELRYKDEESLKLLGWDGTSAAFEFVAPWERVQQQRATTAAAVGMSTEGPPDTGRDEKRRKVETVDLTVEEDSDEDAEVVVAPAPAKPEPKPIVLD